MTLSDCASLSESSHLTRSTILKNEKKKYLKELNGDGPMQRTVKKKTWGSYFLSGKPLTLVIKNHKQRKSACL